MAEDMRVRRTKRLLKAAFGELIATTPLAKMSVKALCERADVSKQAFYLHYSDIYALADEWVAEQIDRMVSNVDFLPLYYDDPCEFVRRFGGVFSANKDFGQLLFRNDLHQVFLRRLTGLVVERLVELRPQGANAERAEVAATMAISGLLALPAKRGAVPLVPPAVPDPAAVPDAPRSPNPGTAPDTLSASDSASQKISHPSDPITALAKDVAAIIGALNAAL